MDWKGKRKLPELDLSICSDIDWNGKIAYIRLVYMFDVDWQLNSKTAGIRPIKTFDTDRNKKCHQYNQGRQQNHFFSLLNCKKNKNETKKDFIDGHLKGITEFHLVEDEGNEIATFHEVVYNKMATIVKSWHDKRQTEQLST